MQAISSDAPALVLQRASGVQPRPLRFLVPSVLPLAKLVLLAGKGSLGKSTITSDLAARLSRGEPAMGLRYDKPIDGETIFATCEDGENDTLVPRLLAAGADLDRIHFLRGVGVPNKPGERPTPWSLAHHQALENTLKENRSIRLLVIDPANAFAGRAGIDGHNDAELRSLLGPLADVASARNVTVLLVTHTRKADCASAVEKVMGSVGWVNAVRAAWMVMHAPPPAKEKLMLPIKCNLWKDARGFVYNTRQLNSSEQELALAGVKDLDGEDWNALATQLYRVQWMGQTDADADSVLAEASKQQRGGNAKADTEKAAAWLAEFLATGPEESERCVREGNAAMRINRDGKWWSRILRDELEGRPRKYGFGDSHWFYTLPDGEWPPKNPSVRTRLLRTIQRHRTPRNRPRRRRRSTNR